MMFFTDRKTNRKAMSWSGLDFKKFEENSQKFNLPYDEVYISVFEFNNEPYFIEHNETINEEEYKTLDMEIRDYLNKHNVEKEEIY